MAIVEKGQLDINLIGEEANQLLLNPVFFDEGMEELFDTMLMVNKNQNIGYVGELGDIIKSSSGCGFNPDGSFAISERTISTEQVKIELELCYDEFKDTIYKQLLKKGTQIGDLTGTVFANLLSLRAQQAMKKNIIRAAFFADKTSTDAFNNYADGMWSVYIPALVADNAIPYINSNSGTPLTAGEGIELLREVFDNSTNFLHATPAMDKVFYVSANVYLQYLQDLENSGQSSAAHLDLIRMGEARCTFRGIEVKPMWEWQAYAAQYLGLADANLVLYTTKKNFVLGTDIMNPANQIDIWNEKREEMLYLRSKFYLGFNYKQEQFLTVAY